MGENNEAKFQPREFKKPWYKTVRGVISLILASIALIAILVFGGFFVYYSLQIKYGDAEKLAKQFSSQFTRDESLGQEEASKNIIEDIDKYIRPYNPTFGNPEAPVKIVAFIDFECPYCQAAYEDFKKMMQKYEPVVQVVFKHLPLTNLHPQSMAAANAASCAQEQDNFWQYYDLLFTEQKLDQDSFISYAQQLNLDLGRFEQCLLEEKFAEQIRQDLLDAVELGLRGTPTYFINSFKIEGAVDEGAWDKIIVQLLGDKK